MALAKRMVLGIETSCDETAIAVLQDGCKILSNIVSSQIKWHEKYGGVVPEVASRKHVEYIDIVLQKAIDEAGIYYRDLEAVAVTYGPGLVGSLLVGLTAAKSLAWALGIPLVGVNHIVGHIYANLLEHEDINLPLVCLTVSGGHTEILYMERWGIYQTLGRTQDDAAGEAFDKIARFLGLGYPGGPVIDKIYYRGNSTKYDFTRPRLKNPYDFSFSGLKTAVINLIHNLRQKGLNFKPEDIAASFQAAIVDILAETVIRAAEDRQVKTVLLSGGVAANSLLRSRLATELAKRGIDFYYPSPKYCTDNGAMIACAGYHMLTAGLKSPLTLEAEPRLTL